MQGSMTTVVLDNQAVYALSAGPHDPRHKRVTAALEALRASPKLRRGTVRIVVPTGVRVEVGWSRQRQHWHLLNSLRLVDVPLDGVAADIAADQVREHGVSVADAHVGATVQLAPEGHVIVVTSDPKDITNVSGDRKVIIQRI